MTDIFRNQSLGPPIDIIAGDTTVLNPLVNRVAVTSFSIHNTTAGAVVVDVYESPDSTSAAGERIAQYSVGANSSIDVIECIGQGYIVGQNLIAVGAGVGTNARLSQTDYTNAT